MVRQNAWTLLVAILVLAAPGPDLDAQIAPLTYEFRAGAAVPVQELADPDAGWAGDVGTGASFGMDFAYTFASYAAGYGGFSQHRFGCRATACGRETDLVATGFDAGIRFILGTGRTIPLLRAGLVSYRVEGTLPDPEGGTRSIVSHRSVGLEAGVGLTVGLTSNLVLAPGLRYLRMPSNFGTTGDLPVRSLIADVGLIIGF